MRITHRSQTDENKETKKFETKTRELDLKLVPTVYIKSCNDCNYTIAQRSTKILIGARRVCLFFRGCLLLLHLVAWVACISVSLRPGALACHSIRSILGEGPGCCEIA